MEKEQIIYTDNSSFVKSIEFYPNEGEIIVNMKNNIGEFTHSYLYNNYPKTVMQEIADEIKNNDKHFGKTYWKYFPKGTGVRLK